MRLHLLLMLLIIISLGCASLPGSSGAGLGLSVGSLTFSPQKINNNQLTKLTIDVENSGNFDILDAYMYLFKLPMSTTDWTISDGELSQTFSLLAPAVRGGKSYGGEKRTFQWIVRAPEKLTRDEMFSFKAGVRACYAYKTIVSGKLEVVSESEWLNKEPRQHPIDIVQSRGPLRIDMISTQPIIASSGSAGETKIKIRVTNAGDGTVTNNDCSTFGAASTSDGMEEAVRNLNRITIGTTDCTFGDGEDIYLQKGQFKEMIISCTPPPGDAPIRTDDFEIEMNYNYYVDREASVNVVGTEEDYVGAGAGAPVTITLNDVCTKLCNANGQKIIKWDATQGNGLGWCRSKAEPLDILYPSAYPQLNYYLGFEQVGAVGETNELNFAEYAVTNPKISIADFTSAIGTDAYSKATIDSLKLHDAKVGDFTSIVNPLNVESESGTMLTEGLADLKLSQIDSEEFSNQYTPAMLRRDTDSDGLPDYWEELPAIDPSNVLNPAKRDTDGDTIPDGEEVNGGKTYKQAYAADLQSGTNKPTLGIVDYFCNEFGIGQAIGMLDSGNSVSISARPCSPAERTNIGNIRLKKLNSISINGAQVVPSTLKGNSITGLTITAIDDVPVSTITQKNPSSKIKGISTINVKDWKIAQIITALSLNDKLENFLKYSQCDSRYVSGAYSRDTICKCLRKQEKPFSAYRGTASGECNAFCTNNGKERGLCANPFYNGYACSGTSLLTITQFNMAGNGCTLEAPCACSVKIGTLSTQEASIICAK